MIVLLAVKQYLSWNLCKAVNISEWKSEFIYILCFKTFDSTIEYCRLYEYEEYLDDEEKNDPDPLAGVNTGIDTRVFSFDGELGLRPYLKYLQETVKKSLSANLYFHSLEYFVGDSTVVNNVRKRKEERL